MSQEKNTLRSTAHPEKEDEGQNAVTEFDTIVETMLSRRSFIKGGAATGAAAALYGTSAFVAPAEAASRLGFKQVAANALDTVTVPEGYNWHVVARWGDPLWSDAPEFDQKTRGTAASQNRSYGDNTDGMALFNHKGHNILAVNNEFTNLKIIFGNRADGKPETDDDVRKGMAAHGVTVVEIADQGGKWGIVKDSPYNRRITAETPMEITGPAAGHDLLKTKADPTGTRSLGTWNNCANGRTPWGTYLTCEENFNFYYSSSDETYEISKELKRYGVKHKGRAYGWERVDERFDISKTPNEPNRNGYVVEIDPLDASSTPKKRTALGRFKHENAELVIARNGHAVVYMGDDERGEFVYKFISAGKYTEGADNSDLLAEGRLFAAKFNDDGTGKWLELNPQTTGMASQAEVCIHTRIGASTVGATTMDRPEWIAARAHRDEVFCCLTNNKNRAKKPNAGGDETPVNGPNPRKGNKYGQIVRWKPDGGDHTSDSFTWDLFVVAGNPAVHSDDRAGSSNVNKDNMFNAPDGIAADNNGLMWIQTDGNFDNKDDFAGHGNNQMLVGDPDSGEIKRFMVGPKQCEVTGICWSPDRRTVFIGIQHPGYKGDEHSNFPDGEGTVPRSALVAIRRDDGGLIG